MSFPVAPDAAAHRAAASRHQDDPVRRRRLRWRARRGLLENDLLLTRFLDRYESELSDTDVAGLDRLLDLADNALMDLILGRADAQALSDDPDALRILARIREA